MPQTAPLTASAALERSHALPPASLENEGRLMAFNWLLASYAHKDWLGPWADALQAHEPADQRLLRHASLDLLTQHGLQNRYLRSQAHAWLFTPPHALIPIARELGVAMLGGWVRTRLERKHVTQQLQVLSPPERAAAMAYATTLKALPYPKDAERWPLSNMTPSAVFDLGVSCMAALLDSDESGAKERFVMRFARGTVTPLKLTPEQRDEALTLILETAEHQETCS